MKVMVIHNSLEQRTQIVDFLMSLQGVGIIGQADTIDEADGIIEDMQPDLVVLGESSAGLRAPVVDDVAVLKQIRRDAPQAIVIMLTQAASAQRRLEFLQSGAQYCLEASRSLDELFRAIQDMSAMTSHSHL